MSNTLKYDNLSKGKRSYLKRPQSTVDIEITNSHSKVMKRIRNARKLDTREMLKEMKKIKDSVQKKTVGFSKTSHGFRTQRRQTAVIPQINRENIQNSSKKLKIHVENKQSASELLMQPKRNMRSKTSRTSMPRKHDSRNLLANSPDLKSDKFSKFGKCFKTIFSYFTKK